MTELEAEMLKARSLVMSALLRSLVLTHPNPKGLKQEFVAQTERLIAELSETTSRENVLRLVSLHREHFLENWPP